jgi:hypothetical protein
MRAGEYLLPDNARIREELAHLFAGPIDPQTHPGRILQHLADAHFSGQGEALKEFAIAVDALGRPASFDPKLDSIVRVEVHKLRRLLREYYEGEGRNRPLAILVAPGGYRLAFAERPGSVETLDAPSSSDAPPLADEGGRSATGPAASPVTALPALEPALGSRLWFAGSRGRAALAAALVLSVMLWWWWPDRAMDPGAEAVSAAMPPALPAASPGSVASRFPLRISAGATEPYTDRNGRLWSADMYHDGGRVARIPATDVVYFTRAPEMFRTRREGDFHYRIPVPAGTYELRLHFTETLYGDSKLGGGGESSRMFRISVNGNPVVDPLDVVSDAGGPNIALTRVFPGVRPSQDGRVHIRFESLVNEKAMVSGLELLPGSDDRALPRRIAVGTRSLRSPDGEEWEAEDSYNAGRLRERSGEVIGAPFSGIFGMERFGNFRYRLPTVPGHRYRLTLWIAEQYFGVERMQPRHPTRQFDILADGVLLASDVKVDKEAGGSLKAWSRTFRGLTGTAQGYTELHFRPDSNYALLNALEWVDEGPAR